MTVCQLPYRPHAMAHLILLGMCYSVHVCHAPHNSKSCRLGQVVAAREAMTDCCCHSVFITLQLVIANVIVYFVHVQECNFWHVYSRRESVLPAHLATCNLHLLDDVFSGQPSSAMTLNAQFSCAHRSCQYMAHAVSLVGWLQRVLPFLDVFLGLLSDGSWDHSDTVTNLDLGRVISLLLDFHAQGMPQHPA